MSAINFDEIISMEPNISETIINPDYSIVLYGAGVGGEYYLQHLLRKNIKPVAVCDTYKAGQEFHGYKIVAIEDVIGKYENIKILITSMRFYNEIKKELLKYFQEESIVVYHPNIDLNALNKYKVFIDQNRSALTKVFNLFADKKSQDTFINILKGKVTGNLKLASEIYVPDQYFVSGIVQLGSDESFIDGGAYVGDTAEIFIEKTMNRFSKIYCFEPGEGNFSKLVETKKKHNNDDRIVLFKAGLYSHSTRLGFDDFPMSPDNAININASDNLIDVVPVDEVVKERVSFIKMDIEGSELDALKGAKETILKYKPKLAICVYHKNEDLIDIPEYILSLGLDYKYYLRHHNPYNYNETVFYAV